MARPTKYKAEYCDEIVGYFSGQPFEEVDTPHGPKKVANPMPTFHGFAQHIGVNEDTVVEWATAKDEDGKLKRPEFSAAYKKAKSLQKWFLIENGLNGVYNPAFAIFTAKNITDMRDKQEVEHTGKDGEPVKMSVDLTNATADELLKFLTTKSRDNSRSRKKP